MAGARPDLESQVVSMMRVIRKRGRVEADVLARRLERTANKLEPVRLGGGVPVELGKSGRRRSG